MEKTPLVIGAEATAKKGTIESGPRNFLMQKITQGMRIALIGTIGLGSGHLSCSEHEDQPADQSVPANPKDSGVADTADAEDEALPEDHGIVGFLMLQATKNDRNGYVATSLSEDTRVVITDKDVEANTVHVDTDSSKPYDNVTFVLPLPLKERAMATVFLKSSCEGNTTNCTEPIRHVNDPSECKQGEKCYTGNDQAPYPWPD